MTPPAAYPSEKQTFTDPGSGREVIQWTNSPQKDQHLYFTSFSVTRDDRWLTFLSERDGHPNLYKIDRADGGIHRVSENRSGLLHAYVYPYGGERGFSKASPALDPDRNRIYWIQDHAVWCGELDGGERPRRLAELPPRTWTAFTHVSPDGKTLCVPVTDERAFDSSMKDQGTQMADTVDRIEAHGWKSWILLVDTDTGDSRSVAEVPFWVTHVQFDPLGSGRILFNMEGGPRVRPRIWCLETDGTFHPLYDVDAEGVDFDTHENWDPRGGAVVYHGKIDGRPYLASRTWEGRLLYRHFLSEEKDLRHTTLTMDGRYLLFDRKDGALGILDPESGESNTLCEHGSSSREQDCHVHALTTPRGDAVVFTSDRCGGVPNVYETALRGLEKILK